MCTRKEKLKELFLSFLDDPKVKEKILLLVNSHNNLNLTNTTNFPNTNQNFEIEKLNYQNKLQAKDNQIAALTNQLAIAKNKITELEDQLWDLQRHREAKISEAEKIFALKDVVGDFQKIHELYLTLPQNLREALSGIFCDTSLRSFVFSGVQADRLMEFWDFCMTDFKRGKNLEYQAILTQLFDFFFKIINEEINSSPRYLKQEVQLGDSFDSSIHTCTSTSNAVGRVSEILLPGIIYSSSRKVFKKSVVVVK